MKKTRIILFLSCALLNANIFASTPLPRGKYVQVRTTTEISSKTNTQNALVIVDADVKSDNGKVLIKAGTPVEVQIDRKKAKGCGRAGTLTLSCLSTTAIDGQRIILNSSPFTIEGDNKKGLAIGLGVGTAVTFLPGIGLAFLAIKGGEATLPARTMLNTKTYIIVGDDYNIQ